MVPSGFKCLSCKATTGVASSPVTPDRCGNCDHHSELHNIHGCTVRIQLEDGKTMVDCPCGWDNLQASSDGAEAGEPAPPKHRSWSAMMAEVQPCGHTNAQHMYYQEKALELRPCQVVGVGERANHITLEVHQHDWMPGFAAFLHQENELAQGAKAHILLNIGSLMSAVQTGDLDRKDLPYMIAESIMHEVIHALESWANVEFSEDRVEELLTKYREKYEKATVWEYTGAEPSALPSPPQAKEGRK